MSLKLKKEELELLSNKDIAELIHSPISIPKNDIPKKKQSENESKKKLISIWNLYFLLILHKTLITCF